MSDNNNNNDRKPIQPMKLRYCANAEIQKIACLASVLEFYMHSSVMKNCMTRANLVHVDGERSELSFLLYSSTEINFFDLKREK